MLHRSLRPCRPAAALSALLFAVPSSAGAQIPPEPLGALDAPIQGVVVDEASYQPVDSATVRIRGTEFRVSTDRWGSFALADLPTGVHALQVSAPGRPTIVQDVEVRENRIVFLQIMLPSVAAVLSELIVSAARSAEDTNEIAHSAADLLALEVPRTRVSTGVVGRSDYQVRLRASNTFQGIGAPMVLIDGVVLSNDEGAYDALERIPASDVEEIQILKGPAAAFLYPFAANGVIHVLTKRGAASR